MVARVKVVPRYRVVPAPAAEAALLAAWRSRQLVTGDAVTGFERALAAATGYAQAVTTANAFSALFLLLDVLGARGREVLLPAVSSCFAVLNAVLAAGASPRFVDVDNDGQAQLAAAGHAGGIALLPGLFGQRATGSVLRERGWRVIEDAALSLHSHLRGTGEEEPDGDLVVFSFYPTKPLIAIDGGAILTHDAELASALRDRRHYAHQQAADGIVRHNLRLPALHAAVGLAELDVAGERARRLRAVAARYLAVVDAHPAVTLLGADSFRKGAVPSRWVLLAADAGHAARLREALAADGIETAREFLPLTAAERIGTDFPVAAHLLQATFSLPFFDGLGDDEVTRVCVALADALRAVDQ